MKKINSEKRYLPQTYTQNVMPLLMNRQRRNAVKFCAYHKSGDN